MTRLAAFALLFSGITANASDVVDLRMIMQRRPSTPADWRNDKPSEIRAVVTNKDGTRTVLEPGAAPRRDPEQPSNPAWPPLPPPGVNSPTADAWRRRQTAMLKGIFDVRGGETDQSKRPVLSLPNHPDTQAVQYYPDAACPHGALLPKKLKDTGRWAVCKGRVHVDCTHGDIDSRPFFAY